LANAAEAPRAEAAAAAAPVTSGADDYDEAGGSWKGFAGAVALLAVSIVAFVTLRHPAPPADAGIFAVTNESAPAPTPAPRLTKKGADAFARGLSLLTDGNVAEALPLLGEAAQQDSQNALYRHTYGRALWLGNQKDAALGELAAATSLNPESPVYWTELARAQKDMGRNSDALRSFEHATNLFPDSVDILKDYGTLLARLDDRQRATAVLKQVADKRPADAQLQQEMAYALETAGDLDSSATLYRRVIEAVPMRRSPGAISRRCSSSRIARRKPWPCSRKDSRRSRTAPPPVPQPGQRPGTNGEHRGSGGGVPPVRRARR